MNIHLCQVFISLFSLHFFFTLHFVSDCPLSYPQPSFFSLSIVCAWLAFFLGVWRVVVFFFFLSSHSSHWLDAKLFFFFFFFWIEHRGENRGSSSHGRHRAAAQCPGSQTMHGRHPRLTVWRQWTLQKLRLPHQSSIHGSYDEPRRKQPCASSRACDPQTRTTLDRKTSPLTNPPTHHATHEKQRWQRRPLHPQRRTSLRYTQQKIPRSNLWRHHSHHVQTHFKRTRHRLPRRMPETRQRMARTPGRQRRSRRLHVRRPNRHPNRSRHKIYPHPRRTTRIARQRTSHSFRTPRTNIHPQPKSSSIHLRRHSPKGTSTKQHSFTHGRSTIQRHHHEHRTNHRHRLPTMRRRLTHLQQRRPQRTHPRLLPNQRHFRRITRIRLHSLHQRPLARSGIFPQLVSTMSPVF
jgi:hypothetical protein